MKINLKKIFLSFSLGITLVFNSPTFAFETFKGDLSDWDPGVFQNPIFENDDDVIKVALLEPFTGPSFFVSRYPMAVMTMVVHDINSQGGIMVDGKMKKVVLINADSQGNPVQTKKEMERVILREKVLAVFGTSSSALGRVAQGVTGKHKKSLWINTNALSYGLMTKKSFNRYSFRTTADTKSMAKGLAYYVAKKTGYKSIYMLSQDYSYGRDFGDGFNDAMKDLKPSVKLTGPDYHKLFLKDFTPYMAKMKAASPDLLVSGDWTPDADNLLTAMYNYGLGKIPDAGLFMTNLAFERKLPAEDRAVYREGSFIINNASELMDYPEAQEILQFWQKQYPKFTGVYTDSRLWLPQGITLSRIADFYMFFEILQKAGSSDLDTIIKTMEGVEHKTALGNTVKMRICDHQLIRPLYISVRGRNPKYLYEKGDLGVVSMYEVPADAVVSSKPDLCK